MNKARKRVFALSTLMAFCVICTVACNHDGGSNREESAQGYHAARYRINQDDINTVDTDAPDIYTYSVWPYLGSSPFDHPGSRFRTHVNDQPVAERTAEIAARVPGVRNVATLTDGTHVVVGLEVNGSADDRQMIEHQVRETLQAAQLGYNVHVTADRDLHARVRALSAPTSDPHSTIHTLSNNIGLLIRDIERADR